MPSAEYRVSTLAVAIVVPRLRTNDQQCSRQHPCLGSGTRYSTLGMWHYANDALLRNRLEAVEQQCALHILDRFGDLDVTRASIGAIEDRAAAPDPLPLVQDRQSFGRAVVAAVED